MATKCTYHYLCKHKQFSRYIMVSVFLAKKMALTRQGQQAQLANNPRFFRGGGITYNLCQK